jgi:hypothetical protein
MRRFSKTFEIDLHSKDEFQYYLSEKEKYYILPVDVDIASGDIFLFNFNGKQTSTWVYDCQSEESRNSGTYRIIKLRSIYPD